MVLVWWYLRGLWEPVMMSSRLGVLGLWKARRLARIWANDAPWLREILYHLLRRNCFGFVAVEGEVRKFRPKAPCMEDLADASLLALKWDPFPRTSPRRKRGRKCQVWGSPRPQLQLETLKAQVGLKQRSLLRQ